jgi:flagellar biosynthetic protein FliQ
MTPDTVINIGQQALQTTVLLAAPMLLSVLAIGLIIGMFQAATQINEMTLSFIPKLMVLALVLMLSGSWMLNVALDFMRQIFMGIPTLIG